MKRAVVVGISEWRLRAHGYAVLAELVYLAGLIRASGIVSPVLHLLRTRRLPLGGVAEAFSVWSAVISVLSGFVASEEILTVFEGLFFDPITDFRLGAQLFNGLCGCSPGGYPRFLRRYLQIDRQNPGYFSHGFVFGFFVQIVPARIVAKHIGDLTSPERRFLLEQLSSLGSESLKFLLGAEGVTLFPGLGEDFVITDKERPLGGRGGLSSGVLHDVYDNKLDDIKSAGGIMEWIGRRAVEERHI
jgi:hypothetical protein